MNTFIRFSFGCPLLTIVAFFVCLIAFPTHLYSQNLIPFCESNENGEIEKQGYKDKKTGMIIIPAHYSQALDFELLKNVENKTITIARVQKNGRWGYITEDGTPFIPIIYQELGGFKEGRAVARLEGRSGFIDIQNVSIVPFEYSYTYPFKDGMARVQKNNRVGFVDVEGKLAIDLIYEDAYNFSEGLAYVKKDGKYGFIDKTGKEIIPFVYENAKDFEKGTALVQKNGFWGKIDKQGNEIVKIIYKDIPFFYEGIAEVRTEKSTENNGFRSKVI